MQDAQRVGCSRAAQKVINKCPGEGLRQLATGDTRPRDLPKVLQQGNEILFFKKMLNPLIFIPDMYRYVRKCYFLFQLF